MVHLLQGIYAISYAHDWQGLSYLHIITVMTSKELIVISTNMLLTILKHKHVYITKLHKKICTVIMLQNYQHCEIFTQKIFVLIFFKQKPQRNFMYSSFQLKRNYSVSLFKTFGDHIRLRNEPRDFIDQQSGRLSVTMSNILRKISGP